MTTAKKDIITKFARKDGDTGSPEVQIALLTARITHITEHMRTHKKDFSTRKGLMTMVNRRKKLLKYLQEENFESYNKIVDELQIRIQK